MKLSRYFLSAFLPALFPVFLCIPATGKLFPGDGPVSISGEHAEFLEGRTLWSGGVRVEQGQSILTARTLEAVFDGDGAFTAITATGAVVYRTGDRSITGEYAFYNAAEQTVTVTGNVTVAHDRQLVSAGRVVYRTDTGQVRFFPDDRERIRGILRPGEKDGLP